MMDGDTFQYKNFTIQQRHAAMKVGTDSDLLGALAPGGCRILDIGTGTGIISLMLAQRYPDAEITAVEIDDNAVKDASVNFSSSPYAERIHLVHASFQQFVHDFSLCSQNERFDCVVCNPPYFDKSTESKDLSRTRARHTSSLPFQTLIEGAYSLLKEGGVFSVCIPPEVLSDFTSLCIIEGFWPQDFYMVKSVPEKAPKRYVLVHNKSRVEKKDYVFCMRNSDRSRSDWYKKLMAEFHVSESK